MPTDISILFSKYVEFQMDFTLLIFLNRTLSIKSIHLFIFYFEQYPEVFSKIYLMYIQILYFKISKKYSKEAF